MKAIIHKGVLSGTIVVPPSKSMMQRACAGALLHRGRTIINNPGSSNDDKAALRIVQQLGAVIINETATAIEIESKGVQATDRIDCGESGLATRLFTPIAALSSSAVLIAGSGSLLKRPMDVFGDIFSQLGVQVPDFNGYIPFTVKGPMQLANIKLDGALSSQFLSGMLFAFAATATEEVSIEVSELKSKPYVDMTLDVLQQFGWDVLHDDYQIFRIKPSRVMPGVVRIDIEADWSSAACWLVAGAIGDGVSMAGLHMESRQADRALLDVLQMVGAQIMVQPGYIEVVPPERLLAFEFDATDCPDLFPVLAILAACCEGESYISGLHRLWHKESNRAESIAEMLQQLEVPFSIEDDMLCIEGVPAFAAVEIDAYNDHRIVMAAAIAALRAKGDIVINGAEAVKKSYPDFFQQLTAAGISNILQND